MLKDLDLGKSLTKEEFKVQSDELEIKIGELQRKAQVLGIPVLIAFEGWEAAGKGTQINRLLQALDPRGYNVHVAEAGDEDERMRPYWWRFWIRTPAAGRFSIFDRTWCLQALEYGYGEEADPHLFDRACREVNSFERQLTDGGTLILKFFLHISRKEQKKRFEAMEANPNTAWKVSKADWQQNKHYDEWREAVQKLLERTDTETARWNLVEAEDRRFATVKILTLLAEGLSEAVTLREKNSAAKASGLPVKRLAVPEALRISILDTVDLSLRLSESEYEKQLEHWQQRIQDMENAMFKKQVPLMVLYEGWDAAGKGGNIRRLTASMDPRGYDVIPVSAPNDIEKAHHYLWRFWNAVPKAGHISILDRTWYGRVLVERVEGFCTEADWKRAYREINEMEEQLSHAGVGLVKFWLHIDRDEQLRRFEERKAVEWKTWKITDEDWRNREKWDLYREAVDEMLFRTGTSHAPWTVVEANDKYHARIKTMKTVVETMEARL
jgi:polyphosphate:AMP phosphotransferase